jgi:hypothetical protein
MVRSVIFGRRAAIVSRSARFAGHHALLALLASVTLGLCPCFVTATAGATASGGAPSAPDAPSAPSPTLTAGMNPFGLPRLVSFKLKPTSVAITLACTGTSAQPCTGIILASAAETLQGKRVIAVSSKHAAKGKEKAIRIAQTLFSIAGGQTAKIQLKLNATGLTLLRRFHAISAYVLGGETLPQGKFVFLVHQVLFRAPGKHSR